MNRSLASIQTIKELHPIEGADRIERAVILGWSVVVRKNEFSVGDKCVYFEIDSLIPKTAWSEFLVDPNHPDKPIRLKTKKLKKVISQGLAIPITAFGLEGVECTVGDDVTEKFGVTKWEPSISAQLSGKVKGNFPSFCRKSDEIRIQSIVPEILNEMDGKMVYVTLKVDGTSATYFNRQSLDIVCAVDAGVCSRNLQLKEPVEGDPIPVYWEIEKKYDILNKMKGQINLQLSGECYGEGIQKNRLGIKGHDIAMFTGYDIDNQRYINYEQLKYLCDTMGIPMVQVVDVFKFDKNVHTMEWWLDKADNAKYPNGNPAEGLVVRPVEECYSNILEGRASFKALSNKYLLKNEE